MPPGRWVSHSLREVRQENQRHFSHFALWFSLTVVALATMSKLRESDKRV